MSKILSATQQNSSYDEMVRLINQNIFTYDIDEQFLHAAQNATTEEMTAIFKEKWDTDIGKVFLSNPNSSSENLGNNERKILDEYYKIVMEKHEAIFKDLRENDTSPFSLED